MTALRPDLAIIAREVAAGTRVLDVGCGDGALMAALRDEKKVDARGMELDSANVAECVARGLSVIQGDANIDLADYPEGAFDYAILSQTLQTTMRPDLVMEQLLRVGRKAFVSFPNFAHWRVRLSLLWGGRMPVTRLLPIAWYETPNIHHVTVDDFRALVRDQGIKVEGAWFLSGDKLTSAAAANFLGMYGLRCAVLERETGAHGQPRAFSCDDEALRIYQQIGLVDRLVADMIAAERVDYVGVDGRPFADFAEFRALVAAEPDRLAKSLAGHLLVYGTGAELSYADREVVAAIAKAAAKHDHGVRAILHEVITSPTFTSK
jgi:methionine biosynthesis protein MetW